MHNANTPSLARRLTLIAAALVIPLAFDRLLINVSPWSVSMSSWLVWALFCLIILAVGIALFIERAHRSPMWWIVGCAMLSCCAWLFIYGAYAAIPWSTALGIAPNSWYAAITGYIALPSLLMVFLQLSSATFDLRRPAGLIVEWTLGWTVNLLTHWPVLAGTCSELINRVNHAPNRCQETLRKIGIAILISLPILCLLVPLLMQADEMFSYGVTHLISDIDLTRFLFHAAVVVIPAPFLFSLLASVDMRGAEPELAELRQAEKHPPFDPTISVTVLGIVLALYAVFCAIQFTFLFAGAGLPAGFTYAQYARQGFFQLLFIASLNLAGYGLVATFVPRTKPVIGMQIGLIAATGVMLVSAATRLGLYVAAYGLTWLRWLSFTFIVLLAVILILALIRLFCERIPLMTISFVLVLIWWIALGWSNPSWVVSTWNATLGA